MSVDWGDPGLWIAVYGAGLSTVLAVREGLKTRRKLKVSCELSVMIGGAKPLRVVSIQIVNVGHRPVVVTQAGLFAPGGNRFVQVSRKHLGAWEFPKKLDDGETVTHYMEAASLREALLELQPPGKSWLKLAFVREATGKEFTSPVPADLESKVRQGHDA